MVFLRIAKMLLHGLILLALFIYIVNFAHKISDDVHFNKFKIVKDSFKRETLSESPDSSASVFQNYQEDIDLPINVDPVEAKKIIIPFEKKADSQNRTNTINKKKKKETSLRCGEMEKEKTKVKAEDRVKSIIPFHSERPLTDPNAPVRFSSNQFHYWVCTTWKRICISYVNTFINAAVFIA
ncbi:hypothetical protein CHS0354_017338 [Potamilus streckersoni]|uniref:Uncharacterized protein n=1 Tax=Potamilus streckersoni TaxID=2493646 RepID=A0AAE0T4E6_9BIVA|nr:hypothetical protein CHS0354_017338 [Potamilus streckersoni]